MNLIGINLIILYILLLILLLFHEVEDTDGVHFFLVDGLVGRGNNLLVLVLVCFGILLVLVFSPEGLTFSYSTSCRSLSESVF